MAHTRLFRSRTYSIFIILTFLLLPLILPDPYVLHILILSFLFGIFAMSWDLAWGYSGIFTLGHAASFGLGAYTSALMSLRLSLSPWLTMIFGGIVASTFGLFIGAPCLRLRGAPYIAITTVMFSEIVRITFSNLVEITRGTLGLWGIPPFSDIGPISFRGGERAPYYYLVFLLFIAFYIILRAITNSKIGYALRATASSEDAAMSIGINIPKVKLLTFAVSSYIAGICGAFYAHYTSILTPDIMSVTYMIDIITMTLLGGMGTLVGPVVGSFIITISLELLRVYGLIRFLLFGGLLIFVIIFMPEGLYIKSLSIIRSLRSKFLPSSTK